MIIQNKEFDTWPVITHANGPGKESNIWKEISKTSNFIKSDTPVNPEDADLTILSWTVPKEDTILQECFRQMNIQPIMLEIEKPFNWLDKIKRVKDILPYIETKYVMCLDSTDIVVSTDEAVGNIWTVLIENFENTGDKLLYYAEKYSWPEPETNKGIDKPNRMKEYIKALKTTEEFETRVYKDLLGSNYCRFNSGAFIGETKFTSLFYNRVWNHTELFYEEGQNENIFGGDQGFLRIYQPEFFPELRIDYNCSIFHCLAGVEDKEVVIHV